MALIQLIYSSRLATHAALELPRILESAVHGNKGAGLTGMLLFSENCFLQVLEGEEHAVHATFQRIERDARHTDIFVLEEQRVSERQFSNWCMGFRKLNAADLTEFPAAAQIFKCKPGAIAMRVAPGVALALLKSFAEGAMPTAIHPASQSPDLRPNSAAHHPATWSGSQSC